MVLDYAAMETTHIPNFLGGEGVLHAQMHVDERNRILHGILPPGSSIGYHTHETSSEIIYILSGTGRVLCDGAYEALGPGLLPLLPPGAMSTA